jgi:aromatic ring-cleaving dioxygenase
MYRLHSQSQAHSVRLVSEDRALTLAQREERGWQVIRKPSSRQAEPIVRLIRPSHHKRRAWWFRCPCLLPAKRRVRSQVCNRAVGAYPKRVYVDSLILMRLRTRTNLIFIVPELRVYRVWDKPIGPHPIAMFEVNLFTPAQFGAFIPWLVINRGPLSALLHPNTGDDIRDHTQRATWLGQPFPLQVGLLRRLLEKRAEAAQNNQQ